MYQILFIILPTFGGVFKKNKKEGAHGFMMRKVVTI